MLFVISLLLLCDFMYCFRLSMSSSQKPPVLWSSLSSVLKQNAREWFIGRAEKVGIDWKELVRRNKMKLNRLEELRSESTDYTLEYPDYYTQPFHGYDEGNLNWEAACEGEPATLNMAVSYWKEINPFISQDWLRYNVSRNIQNYLSRTVVSHPNRILDVGCSVGISTEYLYRTFRNSNITAIDLSPYFISVAKLRAEEQRLDIQYFHSNAEKTHFDDSSFDMVTYNFLMHELPTQATKNVLAESYRVISSGGMIAVVDLTPRILKNKNVLNNFKRWAFEVTEPHIYGYYTRDMSLLLREAGFINVSVTQNDPFNSIWIASKP